MNELAGPILLFAVLAGGLGAGMLLVGWLVGPKRSGAVKEMPYESGMDPVHDARQRFDVRFHVVALVFLIFDVELLFLYPWAVAHRHVEGFQAAVVEGVGLNRLLLFGEMMLFVALLTAALAYAWRKGVFRWR